MKRLVAGLLVVALSFGSATLAAAQCLPPGATQLPMFTAVWMGPQMHYYAANFADVASAIVGGRDAWNVTDAAGRIAGFGGVTASDCPMGQPLQIGAHHFQFDDCATTNAYGFNAAPPPGQVVVFLAYVDYFGSQCAGCGTKSMSLNLAVPWSTNPGVGQYDIQSVVAHEFGHMLGVGHMAPNTACNNNSGPTCAADPNRNTMQANTSPGVGETCAQTINGWDKLSADVLY